MNDMPNHDPHEGDVIVQDTRLPVSSHHNPFERQTDDRTHAGAVAIESQRATAEVQSRMVIAKRFPRDPQVAYARAMEACQRLGLAESAIYTYNRGEKVEGPSIRLAEELARIWGNIEFGTAELSRKPGTATVAGLSEMEAYAWDLETNARSSQKFTVTHVRDKRGGNIVLTGERDIYEVTANQGARRLRARILAVLPGDLVDDAVAQCRKTMISGGKEPFGDRVRKMVMAFSHEFGINDKALVRHIGASLDTMTPDHLVTLRGIYTQLKDGAKASDFFGAQEEIGSKMDRLEREVAKTEATKIAKTAVPSRWLIKTPNKPDTNVPISDDWLSWWTKEISKMQGAGRVLALRELVDLNRPVWVEMEALGGDFAGYAGEISEMAEKALAAMQ